MKLKSVQYEKSFTARMQRPTIKDPRLVLGILLILLSIISVVLVLKTGNQTAPYYAAKREIAVGKKISTDDIQLVEAKLNEAQKNSYLSADQPLEGAYATRLFRSGELMTRSDITDTQNDTRRKVTIILGSAEATSLASGDRVDIWVSEAKENSQEFQEPQAIMRGAEIENKSSEESLIGGTGKISVTLLVVDESLPTVLKAVNNGAKINLIPTNYSTVDGEQQ